MSTWAEAIPSFGWRAIPIFFGGGARRGGADGHARVSGSRAGAEADLPVLVARIRSGDVAALEHLYVALFPRVLRFARRYAASGAAAEDLVHDAFLALWDRREGLDAGADVALYLITAVRHRVYNAARHDRYVRQVEALGEGVADSLPGMGAGAGDVLEQLEAADLRAALVRAVDALPELQRRVVTFRWRTTLSYEAIAAELGITVKMVRLNLERAYNALRPFLRHLTDG